MLEWLREEAYTHVGPSSRAESISSLEITDVHRIGGSRRAVARAFAVTQSCPTLFDLTDGGTSRNIMEVSGCGSVLRDKAERNNLMALFLELGKTVL